MVDSFNHPLNVHYRLDENDNIMSVGQSWESCSRLMGAPDLTEEAIRGTTLWDHIHGEEIRHLFRKMLEKVRRTKRTIDVPFRCDNSTVRVFMQLSIASVDNRGLDLSTRVTRTEDRPLPILFDEQVVQSTAWVSICSWCNRVQVTPKKWLEVEDAVNELHLFDEPKFRPKITHGICEQCVDVLEDL